MSSDIEIIRGDDISFATTFTDENGDAVNLTGSTVFFTVKEDYDKTDAEAVISKSVISHTSPASGITSIVLTNSDTTITPGDYYWDIQIKDSNSKISSIKAGKFIVSADITNRTT
jgi:hypothetical protein